MIPQRNISLIANGLARKGGRRVLESVIERDYVLAWLLNGLAEHSLREVLAFKDGTALRRCWFEHYRFSEDLDFTMIKPMPLEAILLGLGDVFARIESSVGLKIGYDRPDRHLHRNSHTFYLRYEGPLPAPNDVKVDITINERLCYSLQDRPILRVYDGFDDLPEGRTLKVYAKEEIIAEKLLALSDPARNEPRDLYDLWYLLESGDYRIGEMQGELASKLDFRQRSLSGLDAAITRKEKRFALLWEKRLAHQMDDLPPFGEVFRALQRALRNAGLP
ncbi:nucleotidyl transferase AbiEii/AbiGii toxin family protein [Chlorobium sp. N1]|uniref:nucleotidyl transferase AbiEii/AbiGii toxin family protein n=1 Tax=Chlorobium sp. N1 TaxID=2491138 RepID=UPI00103A8D18|nr:nucleotidyl transferase AbiEii/AbiGii toxin family protein [Chlorobium sp. N1]TCD47978.1 nucleotidyl transferase AbiEii/AbiGii toxin family protein [Chlorobium sp. N1]